MATLLRASVLSDDEKKAVARLESKIRRDFKRLNTLSNYYEAAQRVEYMGIALPPELAKFGWILNVPRMAVDEPVRRQRIRAFYRIGDSTKEDPTLREAWEYNNLASESSLTHKETRIFGRTWVMVGANADDQDHPLITTEDPRNLACDVDARRRVVTQALRKYRDADQKVTFGTLYLPDATIHLQRTVNGWEITDRDDHELGVVPVIGFFNRRRSGSWQGTSEMADVMGPTDAIARMVTNMGVASETHAVPSRWAAGVSKGDFVDEHGKMLPVWEAYFTAIRATENQDAKFGQFSASDLKNFHDSVNNMLAWCAAVLGLPTRYAGQASVNPPTEGAIRADEARLITNVEWMNTFDGDSWAWAMGLEERFRTGKWGAPNSIRTLWHDPGTPTYAQTADGAVKLRQVGALSIEGIWDELGWDEARKQQEKARLAEEATDPVIQSMMDKLSGSQVGS
jgi:hypothetical protein